MNDDDSPVTESPIATPNEDVVEEPAEEASEEQQALPEETSEEVAEEVSEDESADESVEESAEPTPEVSAPPSACPVAATGLSAEAGNNEVTLSWSPGELPVDDERFTEPVAFYVSVTGLESKVLRTTETTLAVLGLRNGVEYSFEVFAATPAGRSAPAGPVSATPTTGMEGVVAGLIVEFADGVDPQAGATDVPGQERVAEVDLVVAEKVADDAVLVELSEPVDLDTAEKIAADLAADEQVEWAEPDQFFFTSSEDLAQTVSVPTDSQYASSQWNLWDAFGISVGDGSSTMTDAWAGPRGDRVTVAVIDTGITAHPDLDGQLVSGYDFVSNPEQLASSRQANAPPVAFDGDYIDETTYGALGRDANPNDPGDWRGVAPVRDSSWHGTKIAGLIAAASNTDGITGIAPEAKIQPIRALSWRGGLLSDIAASITWASGGTIDGVPANTNPSKVINMSFAVEAMCPVALQQAIDGALERGSILVAAAGNASDDASKYAPGNCNGVITVAATNRDGNRADYSNYGDTIDISAPGGDSANPITTTSDSGAQAPEQPTTAADSGTSIAAAHVSAAAAILASRNASITPSDAFTKLTGTDFTKAFNNEVCDSSNPDYSCGTGILSLAQISSGGSIDYAMTFDGTSQYATTSGDIDLGSAFTYMAWVKPDDSCSSWQTIAHKSVSFGIFCFGNTWQVDFVGPDGTPTENTGIAVKEGVWQHIAVTRATNNSPVQFFFNGQPAFTGAVRNGAVNNNENNFTVGAQFDAPNVGRWFNGVIDETRIYSSALNAGQITSAMNNYGPVNAAGLVAYYDFNEGSGTTVANVATGAPAATDLTTNAGPEFGDVKTESGTSTLTLTFPRSYLNSAGGWAVPSGVTAVQALVVGGGGGGGAWVGGGGGGGGVTTSSGVSVTPGNSYAVTVGVGGLGAQMRPGFSTTAEAFVSGYNGTSSSFGSVDALGGGVGGSNNLQAPGGGDDTVATGGGAPLSSVGPGVGAVTAGGLAGSSSQPHPTGGGGGAQSGGGSGQPNSPFASGAGGAGKASAITGSSVTYGGGGGGSAHGTWPTGTTLTTPTNEPGAGGDGGGGSGGRVTTATSGAVVRGGAGTAGLGGGGGGAANMWDVTSTSYSSIGGDGGSGIVIVSYGLPGAPTAVAGQPGPGTVTVSWSAPTSIGDSALTGYSVTQATVSGGPYTAVSAGTCTSAPSSTSLSCTVTGLTVGQDYYFKVAAINGSGTGPVSDASSAVVPFGTAAKLMVVTAPVAGASGSNLATQPVIRVTDSGDRTVTTSTASVTVATSGGTLAGGSLTVSAEAGIATFSGLTFSGLVGTTYTLTFSSSGLTSVTDDVSPTAFGPATRLSITTPAGDTTYGTNFSPQPEITVLDAGGNTVTDWATQVNAEVTKWPVSIPNYSVAGVSAGVATFGGFGRALDAGTWGITYSSGALTTAYEEVEIARGAQATLSMSSPSTAIYGETITLTAVGGSGTGALSFGVTSPIGPGLCSLSGTTLTLGDVGSTCKVQATKAATSNYLVATSAEQTITITQAGQTVAFTSDVPETPERFDTYTPTATAISTVTGSSSGVTPSFSASGNCTIAGGVVTFGLPGTCTVTASAASNTNYAAAANVTQTIVVGSTNQTIDFTQPSNVAFGSASVAMSASTSSGGDVTFTLGAGTTNSACTVTSLGVVTILAVGTCEVVASSGAFDQYAAASDVTRAFHVLAALPTAPSLTSASASSEAITVAFTAPGFTGGASISGYQIVATPPSPGVAVTTTACSSSPCTITGLTNGTTYTVTVAAINSVGTGPASSASTSLTPATAAFAVGSLSATPGDTTVTVSWTQPANLGGGTFTRYDLYTRVVGGSYGSATAIGSIGTTSSIVTGLTNGTSYEFKVVTITTANATEIAGNTAEVVQYPSTVPTAPLSPVVLAATTTSVQFSWSAPLSDGGSELGEAPATSDYTVTVTGPSIASNACNPGATGTTCTVSGLINGEAYIFEVVANNRMGSSAAATVTYNVPSADASLAALVVAGSGGAVALNPAFASGTLTYTAQVTNAIASVTVTPTTTAAGATVTVNGVAVVSGAASVPIALVVGTTTIRVLVTASNPGSTQTYTVAITRAAAPGGGGSVTPADRARVPVTPPAEVVSGSRPGAVLLDGQLDSSAAFAVNATNSGWSVVDNAFALSARTESATGAPIPMTPQGVMQVPQGGLVVLAGSKFLPGTDLNLFAIPIDQGPVTSSSRVRGLITPRSTSGAVYLGSVSVSSTGAVSGSLTVPLTMSIGSYVLQINGAIDDDQVASVNMLLDVVPGSISMRSALMREAAFYQGASAKFTANGKAKLRAMVAAIPAGAQDVEIAVVGVSVSLDTPRENLRLARDRAENIVQYLKDADVEGTVTISLTTSFDLQSFVRSKELPTIDKPMVSGKGKPLTTLSIGYEAPGT